MFRFSLGFLAVVAALILGAQAHAQSSSSSPAPLASAQSETIGTVLVPKGTPVVVKTEESYNSYSAHTGETLHFEVVQDVIVDGHVVARAGDGAEGAVKEGQAGETGFWGIGYKAANLRLGVDAVHNFCGDTLHVNFDRSEYRRRQGMFGSNKDVTVIKGQMYVPVVSYAQKLCGVATAATPAPIPPDAIRTADH